MVEAFVEREVITGYLDPGPADAAGPAAPRRLRASRDDGSGRHRGSAPGWWRAPAAGVLFGGRLPGRERPEPGDPRRPHPDHAAADSTFIAYGLDPLGGARLNVAVSAGLGLIGAAAALAAATACGGSVVAGALAVILMSMIEPFLRPRLLDFGSSTSPVAVRRSRPEPFRPASLIFVVVGAGHPGRPRRARAARRGCAAADPGPRRLVGWVAALVLIAILYTLPRHRRLVPEPGARPGRALRPAGSGPEHRGRLRRPAGPRLCRVLRGGRLLHRPPHLADLVARAGPQLLGGPADRRRRRGRHRPLHRRAGPPPARRLPGHRDAGLRRDRPRAVPVRGAPSPGSAACRAS